MIEALNGAATGQPGFSGASLRGLGASETLVLLNGRRVANYAFTYSRGQGVDLHTIPLAAIERVEVLKDGASAIYGSDAIGGVINFVTRKDYKGVEALRATTGGSEGGGGAQIACRASLDAGAGRRERGRLQRLRGASTMREDHAGTCSARDRAVLVDRVRLDRGLDRTKNLAPGRGTYAFS